MGAGGEGRRGCGGIGARGTDGVAAGAGGEGGTGAGLGAPGGALRAGSDGPGRHSRRGSGPLHGSQAEAPGVGAGVRPGAPVATTRRVRLTTSVSGRSYPAHVDEPPGVAKAVVDPLQAAGNAPGQGQGDLRAEAGGQVDRELDGIPPAARQVERAQLGVRLLEVGHRGHDSVLEDLHSDDVLDAHAHRVPGEALRVGHHDLIGGGAEHVPQGHHLRARRCRRARGCRSRGR